MSAAGTVGALQSSPFLPLHEADQLTGNGTGRRFQPTNQDSAIGREGEGWPPGKTTAYEFTYSQNVGVVLDHVSFGKGTSPLCSNCCVKSLSRPAVHKGLGLIRVPSKKVYKNNSRIH